MDQAVDYMSDNYAPSVAKKGGNVNCRTSIFDTISLQCKSPAGHLTMRQLGANISIITRDLTIPYIVPS